jgi:MerR family transcriptional regulator, redox-sensitive transcriptional activator SoxR
MPKPQPDESLTIGEVARRTGVRASALRFYEREGVLEPSARVAGRRRYDAEAVRIVEVVRFAQSAGFSLAEIRTLFGGFPAETPLAERWALLAQSKLRELDELVLRATRMRHAIQLGLGCGCVRWEDCVISGAAAKAE